jgi:hypothetical protein
MNARRILTTAEPCSSFDRDPVPGARASVAWSVWHEPLGQYSATAGGPCLFVYRTPSKDTAQALAVELNRTGPGHYFYHRAEA